MNGGGGGNGGAERRTAGTRLGICDSCAVPDSVSYAKSDGLHIAYQVVSDGPLTW
jgi:hypothetical protein